MNDASIDRYSNSATCKSHRTGQTPRASAQILNDRFVNSPGSNSDVAAFGTELYKEKSNNLRGPNTKRRNSNERNCSLRGVLRD